MNTRGLHLVCLVLRCLCRALPADVREESYAEWCAELQPVRDAGGQGRLSSAGRVAAYCAGHALSVARLRRIYRKPPGVHAEQARRRARVLVSGATAVGIVIGLAATGPLGRPTSSAVAALARNERLLMAVVVLWVAWIRVSLTRLACILERRSARRPAGGQGGPR
ncbi:hypothetical protein [Streptomyces griseorubiginosus]|uniref:hypothetical protein n=1 Tax=Streptomyces griseorubiginosus TaxID=67304 RepID=UPI0034536ECE